MAVRDDFAPGEVLAAADLNDTFASKADYPTGGSDGDVLVKDGTSTDWAAPTPQGLTLISSESFSAVSTVSVNSVFSSGYENYRLLIYVDGSADGAFSFRMRASGSDSAAANHDYQILNYAATTLTGGRTTGGTAGEFGRANTGTASLHVDMCAPFAAKRTTWTSLNSYNANSAVRIVFGRIDNTTSFDGISLIPESGTITGTLRVYGYRN